MSDALLQERSEQINRAWQAAYDQASVSGEPKKAVLGIDIGGTKIGWAVYPVTGSKVALDSILSGRKPTPKGVLELSEAYSAILSAAINLSAEQGYVIGAIGVGSPGRFITGEQFDKTYPKPLDRAELTPLIGNPFTPYAETRDLPWKNSANDTIAPGSVPNLGKTPEEYGGVKLGPLFQRLSPDHLQLTVNNDAALQLAGSAHLLKALPDERDAVDGRKIIYLGLGTGLGTAVMSAKGTLVTDGHYQFTKLPKQTASPFDAAVFEIVSRIHKPEYLAFEKAPSSILLEDIFSGTGIGQILKAVFKDPSMTPEKFGELYKDSSTRDEPLMSAAIGSMRSVGRYLGNVMVNLHEAQFTHIDPRAEWPKEDKKAIAGYQTVMFGGGLSQSQFFHELIVPEARAVLSAHQLDQKVELVFPKNAVAAATYAAALTLSNEALEIPLPALRQLNLQSARSKMAPVRKRVPSAELSEA